MELGGGEEGYDSRQTVASLAGGEVQSHETSIEEEEGSLPKNLQDDLI